MLTDINECLENPSICGERECENSYGTYTCLEPPTTAVITTTTEASSTTTKFSAPTATIKVEEEDENEEGDGNESKEGLEDVAERENESEISKGESDEDSKSETEEVENVNAEINKIPTKASTSFEHDEIESEKVGHREDSEENSIDTREEIDSDKKIPETVSHSTPVHGASSHDRASVGESNEDSSNESEQHLDGEDGEGEDEDGEDGAVMVEEKERARIHHQSSTVKSHRECDDGLHLDDTGNCVGEYY
jgi:hypothetical protein